MKRFLVAVAAMALAGASVLADHHEKDLMDTAVEAGSLTTLTHALNAADLVDILKGPGPFTVFAPTDEAFTNLPAGTLDTLLKPENKEQLRSVLTYHVVPGRVTASEINNLTTAKTVNGQDLYIYTVKGIVEVNGAKVTKTDILAANGVIHVIDKVVLPVTGDPAQAAMVTDRLADFESKSTAMRRDAMFLESTRRNSQLSWQTHADKLHIMKLHVNELGQMLADLESMKPNASLFQQRAIEAARPHLEDVAERVENAISWLNEDRRNITAKDYKDNLHGIWTDAGTLCKIVDTILDYHEARMRLAELRGGSGS